MPYVDGFVIPVPKDKLATYKEMAQLGREIWMGLGALSYMECVADDVPNGEVTSFPRSVQAMDSETVIFSWITYESRAKRDEINAKAMTDPRMKIYEGNIPFDDKRMIFGGFQSFVES